MFVRAFFTRCRVGAFLGASHIGEPGASLLVAVCPHTRFEWADFDRLELRRNESGLFFFSGVHSGKLPLGDGSVAGGDGRFILDAAPIVTESPSAAVNLPFSRRSWLAVDINHRVLSFPRSLSGLLF